jgi:TolA-binding protein
MAKPDPVKPAESKPTLVSVENTPSRSGSQERKGRSSGLWILGALVLVLGAFALWQSQQLSQANERIATLEDRVLGLDSQLWAAQTQIQTYEMQRGLVREAVTDISDRMTALREMVGAGPAVASALEAKPVAPEAAPETTAAEAPVPALEATPAP